MRGADRVEPLGAADVAGHGVFFAADGPETFGEIVPLRALHLTLAELFNVSSVVGILYLECQASCETLACTRIAFVSPNLFVVITTVNDAAYNNVVKSVHEFFNKRLCGD